LFTSSERKSRIEILANQNFEHKPRNAWDIDFLTAIVLQNPKHQSSGI